MRFQGFAHTRMPRVLHFSAFIKSITRTTLGVFLDTTASPCTTCSNLETIGPVGVSQPLCFLLTLNHTQVSHLQIFQPYWVRSSNLMWLLAAWFHKKPSIFAASGATWHQLIGASHLQTLSYFTLSLSLSLWSLQWIACVAYTLLWEWHVQCTRRVYHELG